MNAGVEARIYKASAVLLDGSTIHIRAIRPDDRDRLLAHFRGLSTQSVLLRFHGAKRTLSDAELTHLTELDFINHVGLVATFGDESEKPLIGVGRYIRSEHDPECAEVGFAILDAHQSKGIGSVLLHHLAIIGHSAGLKELDADVLTGNLQMMEVLEHSGFKFKHTTNLGVDRLRLRIA